MTVAAPQLRRRLRVRISGAVQGVGMRPFLYRTARELGLDGWIRNDTRGVILEVEGPEAVLRSFEERLWTAPPLRAVIREVDRQWLEPTGATGLRILPSDAVGERVAAVLPDLATCPACLADIGLLADGRTTVDRRTGYPFTNCTDCGPRFSIIRALPYDRPNTTMAAFQLCPECRTEYEDPMDRRFHAQPTACPECGPVLTLRSGPEAGAGGVAEAAGRVAAGEVVAVKGLGGFHLLVDAGNSEGVARLRARKHRPTKPLAVMVRDVAMARTICEVSREQVTVLESAEAPIVLLRKRPDADLAENIAPGNPYLGVMLPYTPLHHLLMRELNRPTVATSGNLSDEPICTDESEAMERLAGIADGFLVHDRPIERPVDDSVVQWLAGAPRLVRRARGYAPLPIHSSQDLPPILAVGGHLKNTIALARGRNVFLSQHIGDLETPQARDAFTRVVADFLRLYDVEPGFIAHDLHPEYASTAWAKEGLAGVGGGARLVGVQHHHAHLASCLADNGVEGPALGVIWDGTGLGPDGTVWGGEFLLGDASGYERVAHLRPFRLPGGDAAVKEPRRMAMALVYEAWGEAGLSRVRVGWTAEERRVLVRLLESGVRTPWTTSAGRLFDGVASILGLRQRVGYEGEAAMALEHAVDPEERGAYGFGIRGEGPWVVDWAPALDELLIDRWAGAETGLMAARFHNGLVAAITAVAERVGAERVALTGGCFQNVVLTERTAATLGRRGFAPVLHRQVPANDGGLALGQAAVAAAVVRAEAERADMERAEAVRSER